MRTFLPLAVVLALSACTDKDTGDTEVDTDTDTEADTDPGTDPDTDTDTEVDTDVDTDFVRCEPPSATLPHNISGDNFFEDYANEGDFAIGEGCSTAAGPEYVFSVDLLAGELLTAAEGGGELSAIFHVKQDCTTYAQCLASVDEDLDGRLEFLVPETGTYIVMVETFNANPVDSYSISFGIAEPEDCTDGVDNDVDGLLDCADQADCGSFPACIEVCDDGIDNDADGFTDCEDNNSCFGVGDCVAACQEDEVTIDVNALPFTLSGTDFSADWPNDYNYGTGDECGTGNGHEIIMAMEMTAGQTYRIAENGPGDMVVRVLDTCVDGDACLLSSDFPEVLDYTAERDGLHYIVIEGWSSTPTTAAWDVLIGIVEDEICDDNIDNDLDGRADCDDLGDCYDTAACPFECPAVAFPDDGLALVQADRFVDVSGGVGPYLDGTDCSNGSGEALVWEVTLAAEESIRVSENGPTDAVWRVMSTCNPGDACLYSSDTDAPTDVIYTALEDETVYLVLESWSSNELDAVNARAQIVSPEVCDDGIDNDGDLATDCFDIDCYDPVDCPVDCGEPEQLPIFLSGDDIALDSENNANFSSGDGCGTGGGPEERFQVELSEGEELTIIEAGGLDAVVRVLENCVEGSECLVSSDFPEDILFVAPADGVYTVVIEAWSSTPGTRDYEMRIGIVEPEVCDDGVDNDLDGRADCADPDCFDPVTCPYECPGEVVTLPIAEAGEDFSAAFTNNDDYSSGADCGFGGGPEAIYQVDLFAGESVRMADTGAADLVLRVVGESCLPGDTCLVSSDFPEDIIFEAPEDGLYTFIFEGWSSTPTTGSYDFTLDLLAPEACDSGEDEDQDGLIDCDDPSCFGAVGLCDTETNCFDGIDEDADGDVDCDDGECANVLGCGGGNSTVVFEEDFDTWPLTDWTVDAGVGGPWVECADPVLGCDEGTDFFVEFPGADGSFAYINSDDVGGEFDQTLLSPEFSLTGFTDALLTFDHYYEEFSGDVGFLEITTDGGTTWEELAQYDALSVGPQVVGLASFAGSATVQIRWRYTANFDWWWAVDNVRVEAL